MQASLYEASIQTPGVFKLGRENPMSMKVQLGESGGLVFCLVIIDVL